MLGPASELGWAATLRRDDLARGVLRDWREVTEPTQPARRGRLAPGRGLTARARARTRPGWPRWPPRPVAVSSSVVLTNAVRYADRSRRPDGRRARRGPPAGAARPPPRRPVQRRGLPQVRQGDGRRRRRDLPAGRASASARPSGCWPAPASSPTGARSTRAPTSASARSTSPSSKSSGLGSSWSTSRRRSPTRQTRCCGSAARPGSVAATRPDQHCGRAARLDDELGVIGAARLRVVLPHRRRRRRPDPRDGGAGRGPRVGSRQPGQLPARASPASTRCATAC